MKKYIKVLVRKECGIGVGIKNGSKMMIYMIRSHVFFINVTMMDAVVDTNTVGCYVFLYQCTIIITPQSPHTPSSLIIAPTLSLRSSQSSRPSSHALC